MGWKPLQIQMRAMLTMALMCIYGLHASRWKSAIRFGQGAKDTPEKTSHISTMTPMYMYTATRDTTPTIVLSYQPSPFIVLRSISCLKLRTIIVTNCLLDYPVSDEISLSCKPGWHWYKGSCYIARKDEVTYRDAQADCSSEGGIVAPVRDFDEYFLIRRLFTDDLDEDAEFFGGQCMFNLFTQYICIEGQP